MRNTPKTRKGTEKGSTELLFLALRLCWTFCLWFLLSDWKLYNEQRSQVTCCNAYFLASVDGIKIQSGLLLRHASRIILQLPSTAGWACLARRVCVRACAFLAFLVCRFYKSYRNFFARKSLPVWGDRIPLCPKPTLLHILFTLLTWDVRSGHLWLQL